MHTQLFVVLATRRWLVHTRSCRARVHVITSQEPLRHDVEKRALISESISVAYSITPSGVPNLIPSEAKILRDEEGDVDGSQE
jgi:uncharacterized protein YbaR (Trm112 family)